MAASYRAIAAAALFSLASAQVACRTPSAGIPATIQGSSFFASKDTFYDVRVDDTSLNNVARNGFLTKICFTSAVRFTDVDVDGVAIEGRGDFMPGDTFGVPLPWPLHQSQWGLLYVNTTLSALGVGAPILYINYTDQYAKNLSFYNLPALPASPPAGLVTSPPLAPNSVSNYTVGRPRPVCPPPSGTGGGGVPFELQGRAYVPALKGISIIDSQGIWDLEGTTLYPNSPFFVARGYCFLNATTVPEWPTSNGTMWKVFFGLPQFPVCMYVQRMANGDAFSFSKSQDPISAACGTVVSGGLTLDCSCAAMPYDSAYVYFTPSFFNVAAPGPWTPSSTPTATSVPTATQSPIPISTAMPVALSCPSIDASTVDPNLLNLRLLLSPPSGTTYSDIGSFSLARGFSNATQNGQYVMSRCVSKSYWPFGNDSTSLIEFVASMRVDIPTAATFFTIYAQISMCLVLVRTETAVYDSSTILGPFYPGMVQKNCLAETPVSPPVEREWKKTGDITTISTPTALCSGSVTFDTYLQGRGVVNSTFAVIGAASISYISNEPFLLIHDTCLLSSKSVGNFTWEITQGRSDSRTEIDCLWIQRWGYDLYVWNGGSNCPSALATASIIYAAAPNVSAVAFYSSPAGQGLVYPTVSPGASPSNSRSMSSTRSYSGTPSLTKSVSATPTPTLSNGATPSTSPTFSTTPTLSPSATPTLSPTASNTASVTATLSTGATPSTTPTQSDGWVPAGAATAAGGVDVGAAVGGTIGAVILLTSLSFVCCFIRGRSLPHRSPMKKMSASGRTVFELGGAKKIPTRNSVSSINDSSFRVATVVSNPAMGFSTTAQFVPPPLPPGWTACSDETDTWYVDPSGQSHWEHPGSGARTAGESTSTN